MAERDRRHRCADRRRLADDRLDADRAGSHRARNERLERLSRRSCRPRPRSRSGRASRRCSATSAVRLGRREPQAGTRRRKRRARAVGDCSSARRRRDLDGQAGQADPLRRAARGEPLRPCRAKRRADPRCPRRRRAPWSPRTRQTRMSRRLPSESFGTVEFADGQVMAAALPAAGDADHDRTCRRRRMERAQSRSATFGDRYLARRKLFDRRFIGQSL